MVSALLAPRCQPAPPSARPAERLRPVAGFEDSGYMWQAGQIVWVGRAGLGAKRGSDEGAAHPRNLRQPWHAGPMSLDAARLRDGARHTLVRLQAPGIHGTTGLLQWLAGRPLPFPLSVALPRFEALRLALAQEDRPAFAAAAPRVLGLGPGLTPSGDDFLAGIFFALAHAPRPRWAAMLPALHSSLLRACLEATNPISAALLADAMQGRSYRALHELLAALQGPRRAPIDDALRALGRIGATSGGDLAAGVLLTLAGPTPSMSLPTDRAAQQAATPSPPAHR